MFLIKSALSNGHIANPQAGGIPAQVYLSVS